MFDPFKEHEDHWIAYADFITTLLGIFLICTVLLIPFLNPEAKNASEANDLAAGNMIITAVWKENGADVDLWVHVPGDVIVGYSNKSGKVANLLRDDLGYPYELIGGIHYENAYTRGLPKGEYIVNLHMYRNDMGKFPIEVEVSIRTNADPRNSKSASDKLFKTTVQLKSNGQEITVMRFKLDENGTLIPGSLNNEFIPLRAAKIDGVRSPLTDPDHQDESIEH